LHRENFIRAVKAAVEVLNLQLHKAIAQTIFQAEELLNARGILRDPGTQKTQVMEPERTEPSLTLDLMLSLNRSYKKKAVWQPRSCQTALVIDGLSD
jgi:hypothetical protein